MNSHKAQEGKLVILAGPSGVGKSSVVSALREQIPDLYFSVSVTTRSPRPGEQEGRDYFFVDSDTFDRYINEDSLLEWAWIHNNTQRSGTPFEPIKQALDDSRPVLVEVDLIGAQSIQSKLPWATSVFLMPPSWNELKDRLTKRGSETTAMVSTRLHTAKWEMLQAHVFDQIIVNTDVQKTVAAITALFH